MDELGESRSLNAAIARAERKLEAMTADERVAWALETLPGNHVVSSSFGAQAAVMLHLMQAHKPGIPVVFIDTGYLFAETYRFVDRLTEQLDLNLQVFRARVSAAWQEARHGRRWEAGLEGVEAYNRENKLSPMQEALDALDVGAWFAGIRRSQASTRRNRSLIEAQGRRFKIHPIADWSDRDVHRYLDRHNLPYHPLWHEGYVSIGDVHTTRTIHEAGSSEASRFNGLRRECGLHEMNFGRTG